MSITKMLQSVFWNEVSKVLSKHNATLWRFISPIQATVYFKFDMHNIKHPDREIDSGIDASILWKTSEQKTQGKQKRQLK